MWSHGSAKRLYECILKVPVGVTVSVVLLARQLRLNTQKDASTIATVYAGVFFGIHYSARMTIRGTYIVFPCPY